MPRPRQDRRPQTADPAPQTPTVNVYGSAAPDAAHLDPSAVRSAIVQIADYQPHPRNYNRHPARQIEAIAASLRTFGQPRPVAVWRGNYLAGHGVVEAALSIGWTTIRADILPDDYPEHLALAYVAADNELARLSDPDEAALAAILQESRETDPALLAAMGYSDKEFTDLLEAAGMSERTTGDTEPQIDRAEELRQKWQTAPGQLWQLGDHRLICGDCTDAATVARVMGSERATLVHADPPYGMGKEKDGIANDNLYREKLDAFQMAWWIACRPLIEDNGSAYIWGNADDLWRLWYCGGLRDSERMTIRNEIVWQKQGAQGIGSEAHRQYPTTSERCLFFMLGEQGFSNNADNYWDGFTPIVEYLESQRKAAKWSIKDTKRIAGHSESSGCHWFDKSQWTMPTQEVYDAWRDAAKGDAFRREYDAFRREYDDLRREYDDLRREWYSTRAYFDNAHDNMTDVWQFGRVTGDERHDHATPKPTSMAERAIKSSAPEGAAVYVPFGGTLPELIACENLARRCRAVELSPAYVAVALERYATHTHDTPHLLEPAP